MGAIIGYSDCILRSKGQGHHESRYGQKSLVQKCTFPAGEGTPVCRRLTVKDYLVLILCASIRYVSYRSVNERTHLEYKLTCPFCIVLHMFYHYLAQSAVRHEKWDVMVAQHTNAKDDKEMEYGADFPSLSRSGAFGSVVSSPVGSRHENT